MTRDEPGLRPVLATSRPAERVPAWSDLVAWVTIGARPEGEDLRGSLLDVGRKWTEPFLPNDPGHP